MIWVNFGSISRNLGDIFKSRGLCTNSWWPWYEVKWTQQIILNPHFRASGPKYSPTYNIALRASWFWPTLARFPATWGIFSSPSESKLFPVGLGLRWNGHSKTFWTLTFELPCRKYSPFHFKAERVDETALREKWFWATMVRFAGTWGIFSSFGNSKLTPDCLSF